MFGRATIRLGIGPHSSVNMWNSLPKTVIDINSVNSFKTCLGNFWMHHDVRFDVTDSLSGTGDAISYENYS